jgi:hypothetical protein
MALTAGCASTVQQRAGTPLASDAGEFASDSVVAGGADGAGGAATAADGSGSAGGGAGASAGNGRAAGATGAAGGKAGSGAAALTKGSGFGYTATELYIGYNTWKDVSRAGGALGIAGADYGDQEATAQAIVDDINGRGGIAGRKVVPVFYDYATSDILGDPSTGDQKACTRYTEDRPVFAVIAVTGPLTEVLPQCLKNKKVPLLMNDNIPRPQKAFDMFGPLLFTTATPSTEHFVHAAIPRVAANGYFGGWDTTAGVPGPAPVKIGLLSTEGEAGDIFDRLVAQELAKLGLKVTDTIKLTSPADESALHSAVLKFRSDSITHVIPDGLNLLLFPQAAESQHFRPRYFVSTVQALTLVQETAPAVQLNGARGVGFFPSYDVDGAHDPGDVGPAEAHCKQIHQKNGQSIDQRNAFNLMVKACDAFAFIVETVRIGGLSTDGMVRAVKTNPVIPPAGAFMISYAGGRVDGPAAIRDLGYDQNERAFIYTSKTNYPM